MNGSALPHSAPMQPEKRRFSELAGASAMASGALFFAKSLLEWRIGPPPSGDAILPWLEDQSLFIALTNELSFFAVVFAIPVVVALYQRLVSTHPTLVTFAAGLVGTTIPVTAMLVIVEGRLVYPMFGMRAHTVEIVELIVTIYFGGMHAVSLLWAAAIVALSAALRASEPRVSQLGWATAAFAVVGAYPDSVGPLLVLVASGFFAAWLAAIGRMLRS